MSQNTKDAVDGFYFLVGQRDPVQYGLTWRVWSAGTSFYIKTKEPALAEAKISLHGPDPRHANPGLKFGLDASAQPTGAAFVQTGDALPWWFPGEPVDELGFLHAVRICVPAETLHPRSVPGSDPGTPPRRIAAGLLQIPPPGHVALLDLYITGSDPIFPLRRRLEELDALRGPLANKSGQHLFGVTRILAAEKVTVPDQDAAKAPTSRLDSVRGVQATLDPGGYLWLIERELSRSWLIEHSDRHPTATKN